MAQEDLIDELLVLAQTSVPEFKSRLKILLDEIEDLKRELSGKDEDSDLHFRLDSTGLQGGESKEEILYEPQDVVLSGGDSPSELDNSKKQSSPSCFNCNCVGHIIANCPEPRNPRRIAANRKEFAQRVASLEKRYHLDSNQKFAHLKAGAPLSEKLRSALDLSKNQLPPWVYKMRVLGYPPGWLKEAEIASSGVRLYAANGEDIGVMDDEEGELPGSKVEYDTNKLVTWVGFNERIDNNMYMDESSYYRVPPIKKEDLISEMLVKMQPMAQKSYIRRDMQDTHSSSEPIPIKRKMEESPASPPSSPIPHKVQKISADVKEMTEGTPIVHTFSPFQTLPTVDKWAKDTTDHILFENLPDYTGKWNNLLSVIKKGRKSLSKSAPE